MKPILAEEMGDDAFASIRGRYTLRQTLNFIHSDLAFRCAYEHKQLNWWRGLRLMRHPGVACVVRFRFQCFLYSCGLGPLGALLKYLNLVLYGVELDERARIGGGFLLSHAVTILVTAGVTIGERCVLFHQNTIGLSPFFEPEKNAGPLVVGNDVTFGGGSCAYGNITIGDHCLIGANAVVDRSYPAGSSLFGVPARVVGQRALPSDR